MSALIELSGPAATGAATKRLYAGPDILRLLAASMVVLYHLSETGSNRPTWPVTGTDAPLGWLQPYAWMGWIGVQMFFVLSGFLISASASNSTALGFLRKRALRIFPALWISCLIAFVVRAMWGEPFGDLVMPLFKSAVLSPKGPYIDGVVWTLVVEAVFYVLICAVIRLSGGGGFDRMVVPTALAIGTASSAFTVIAHLQPDLPVLRSFLFDVLLLRQGMFFAIGMLLFRLIENQLTPVIRVALVAFTLAAAVQIADMVDGSHSFIVPLLIWMASSLLMFLSVKHLARFDLGRWQVLCRELGLLTYPLYLNHFVLSQALMPVLANWLPAAALLPGIFCLLLANAWLIARYPEKALQRRLAGIGFGQAARGVALNLKVRFAGAYGGR